jgi:hypothetical protein
MAKAVAYLEKRESRMQYPQYQAHGWPIGSGMVESGNKVVMQARRVWGWHATSHLLMSIPCSPYGRQLVTIVGMKPADKQRPI